jgi:hypothetical protein
MAGMAFDAEDLSDDLELLACFVEDFETHATADFRQLSWQVYERAFRTNILSGALGHDVRAAWVVPLGFYLEAREVTWSGTIVSLNVSRHVASFS